MVDEQARTFRVKAVSPENRHTMSFRDDIGRSRLDISISVARAQGGVSRWRISSEL
jgi:hypothetical protein